MDNVLKKIKDAEQLFSSYEITGNELARVRVPVSYTNLTLTTTREEYL